MATKERVTIHPAGGEDEFGDPLPGGGQPFDLSCVVTPRHSSEDADRGVTVISGYQLIFKPPPRQPIASADQITVRGVRQSVEGVPGLYIGKALEVFTQGVNTGG